MQFIDFGNATILTRELYKPIARQQDYFVSGNFDQLQRNIPRSVIVNVFMENQN